MIGSEPAAQCVELVDRGVGALEAKIDQLPGGRCEVRALERLK
jgi:hypothetical protein